MRESSAVRHPILDKLRLTFVSGWYSTNDPTAKDRCRHLACNYTANLIANMIGGTFWTGLLLVLNADDSFIGTLSIISTSANMLQLFAPLLLEQFPRRRTLLSVLRAVMYFFNIVFIGLIPLFPLGQQGRLVMLALSVLVVNLIAALSGPGINIWHIQSIPDRVRKNYFSLITMTNSVVVALFNLIGSRVVDWFKIYDMEYQGLFALRLFALVLATIEIYLYFHITEHPYEKADKKFTLKDVFVKPFRNRSYMLTVLCPVLWNFAVGIPGSYHSVYMLKNVGVSYSYIMLISTINIPLVFLVTPLWNKVLSRLNWFKTLAVALPIYALGYFGFGFTSRETLFAYPLASILCGVVGIGVTLSFSGIPYANMPPKNSTIYIAFYSTMANCAALLGVTVGKYFILATEGITINVLGLEMINKQYLMLLSGSMILLAAAGVAWVEHQKRKEERAQAAASEQEQPAETSGGTA